MNENYCCLLWSQHPKNYKIYCLFDRFKHSPKLFTKLLLILYGFSINHAPTSTDR